jgi:hypothetical protein
MRRASTLSALLFLTVAFGVARAADSIPPDVLKNLKRATVHVKATFGPLDYSGSGFVIQRDDKTVYIVTNSHVVEPPRLGNSPRLPPGFRARESFNVRAFQRAAATLVPAVTVVFDSGTGDDQSKPAVVVASDVFRDLAILKVTGLDRPPESIALSADVKPIETMPIFTLGFPYSNALGEDNRNPSLTVIGASVASIRPDRSNEDKIVQIDGEFNSGNSGGPVVDAKGRLVGIAKGTVQGTGPGLAISPETLKRQMTGGVGRSHLKIGSQPNGSPLTLEITLFDPFQKVKGLSVYWVLRDEKNPPGLAKESFEGAEKLELKISDGKARGQWTLPDSTSRPTAMTLQPVRTSTDGKIDFLPVVLHNFPKSAASKKNRTNSGGPSGIDDPASGKPRNFYIRGGSTHADGATKLTEGMLVLPTSTTAIGFGVTQSGDDSMELTYVILAKLPTAKTNRKATSNRSTSVNNQVDLIYGTILGDLDLTIKHSYVLAGAEKRQERYHILDREFDPTKGRVFLVDLTAEPKTFEQLEIELPKIESVKKFTDASIAELAAKTRDELQEQDERIGQFLEPNE